MPELLTITIVIELPDGTSAAAPTVRVETQNPGTEPENGDDVLLPGVVARVRASAPRPLSTVFLDYLRRCVTELGARPAEPSTGTRPNVNVNAPVGVRGARLASFNVSSGRLAFRDLKPDELEHFPGAQVVSINDKPDHLKVYLGSADDLERAMSMTRAVLDRR